MTDPPISRTDWPTPDAPGRWIRQVRHAGSDQPSVPIAGAVSYWWTDNGDVDQPTPVDGFIAPATFTVTGLGYGLEFTTRIATRDDQQNGNGYLAFDKVTVVPAVPAVDVDVPFGKIIRHAAIASGARGLRLPSTMRPVVTVDSDGTFTYYLNDDELAAMPADAKVAQFDPGMFVIPTAIGPMTKRTQAAVDVANLIGVGQRRRNELTDAFLREVADVFRSADYGDQYAEVQRRWATSRSNVTKWIRLARERGLLEDVSDNDGRKTRRKDRA
jgi:transposase-like protein